MNTIISILLLFAFSPIFVIAKQIPLDNKISKPDAIKFFDKPAESTLFLQNLLKDGKIIEFYIEAKKELTRMGLLSSSGMTEEELKKQVWLFYLIAVTPLYNEQTTYELSTNKNEFLKYTTLDGDLFVKELSLLTIPRFNNEKMAQKFSFPAHEFSCLMATYYARILRSFFDFYTDGSIWKIHLEKAKNLETKSGNEFQKINSRLTVKQNRLTYARSTRETAAKSFLKKLISYFPGKKVDIQKYLLLSGYKEENITDLIDSTVGRTSSTEFLYKGRKSVVQKKKNDKKKLITREEM